MKDILIIKTKAMIKSDMLAHIHEAIVKQIKTGVVVLPMYLDAELVNIPDDIEVVVENEKHDKHILENREETP
jgi:hypothetical protein